MKSEATIQKEIQLALSKAGCIMWRNESAGVWAGRILFKQASQVTLDNASFIKSGLCVGSSDLIGLTPCGRFLAVEVKTPKGKPTDEQINFINAVNAKNGIGYIARSAEEAIQELEARI
jgi:hypothetical protein